METNAAMQSVSPARNQLLSILALGFFLTLILIGLFWGKPTSTAGFFALLVPGVIFFLVIIYKLSVWKVLKEGNRVVFSNFLGLYKVTLDADSDFLDAKGSVIRASRHAPWDNTETGQFLELKTTRGKFRFSSEDYPDFDELTNLVFEGSPKLAYEYGRSLTNERNNHRNPVWIYVLVAIAIILVVSALKR